MHVIATLDAEGQLVAKRTQQRVGAGAQRSNYFTRIEHALVRRYAPAPARLSQAQRLAFDEAPASLEEEIGIGLRQALRIGGRKRLGELGAADRGLGNIRFEFGQPGAVQHGSGDAERLQLFDLGEPRVLATLGAEHLDPAAGTNEPHRPRRLRQREMLGRRRTHQLPHCLRGRHAACRIGGEKVAPEKRRNRRQRRPAHMRPRIEIERRPRQFERVARKNVGEHRLALDDAGVPEARVHARRPEPVDQHDGATARLQMQRRRHADKPGAENDHID